MRTTTVPFVLGMAVLTLPVLPIQRPAYRYAAFEVPGAIYFLGAGINNRGEVAGTAYLAGHEPQTAGVGFRKRGRQVTVLAWPGGSLSGGRINDRGMIAGSVFTETVPSVRGYTWKDGTFASVDACPETGGDTHVEDIDNRGGVCGCMVAGRCCGFTLRDGRLSMVDIPGAAATSVYGMNDAGALVGAYWETGSLASHGFLLTGGRVIRMDYPGAALTRVLDVNARGEAVGMAHFAEPLPPKPFVWRDGAFSGLDVPGAISAEVYSLNDRGQVIGAFRDARGWHGFIATPVGSRRR